MTSPLREPYYAFVLFSLSKRIPFSDDTQMSLQTFYSDSADVLNVLIKSATSMHVVLLILPTCGRVIIQSPASLVSHMC